MNKYLYQLRKRGSINELDDLIANRNVLLAQGNPDALLLDAKIAQLKQQGMKPTQAACFAPNAQVLTPKGYKDISTLKEGDTVISLFENERTFEKIKKVQTYAAAVIHDYHLDNGSIISATRHHTVLTEKGWKKLGDISIGEKLVTGDARASSTKLEKINKPRIGKVYNLHTTGPHNFIVDGMVAHNFTFARRFRSFIHDLREFIPNRDFAIEL